VDERVPVSPTLVTNFEGQCKWQAQCEDMRFPMNSEIVSHAVRRAETPESKRRVVPEILADAEIFRPIPDRKP
jgi:hypothetical protein